ncbi:MAG: nucleotide exchange factor GrpE [Bacteroidales bacterium]|jgi:molecular chaperone GrpE|nr:nucleotide exchange factor GrpE [Bacteroidales bacterium]
MVKKKRSGQEEPVGRKHDEPTDNKANNNSGENSGTEISGNPPVSETGTPSSDGSIPKDASSDKVVNGEKTCAERLAEIQDKYIRLSAEFDNYRKRTLREKIELTKYAGENIFLKILPVMDDFERAISLMDAATDRDAMKSGIDLIYGKFTEFLRHSGVREVESMNCDFNVDLHYAVAKAPVQEEDKKGKIVEVIQKGYYLQDKVIRHSKVVIGE